MVLAGLAYLKGQSEVLALADDAYPPWLWTLLEKKELPDDGLGGSAEKVRLRNRELRCRLLISIEPTNHRSFNAIAPIAMRHATHLPSPSV